jgi:hypothetical protein
MDMIGYYWLEAARRMARVVTQARIRTHGCPLPSCRSFTSISIMAKPTGRQRPFQDMPTAPRNGAVIEVRHGPDQLTVEAYWAGQNQAFIAVDDPHRRSLQRVTGCRSLQKDGP